MLQFNCFVGWSYYAKATNLIVLLLAFTMPELSKELLEILACPKCKGPLEYRKKEQKLVCKKCKLAYRVEDGIPVMLVEEAEKLGN